jgi:hypothetical protein
MLGSCDWAAAARGWWPAGPPQDQGSAVGIAVGLLALGEGVGVGVVGVG